MPSNDPEPSNPDDNEAPSPPPSPPQAIRDLESALATVHTALGTVSSALGDIGTALDNVQTELVSKRQAIQEATAEKKNVAREIRRMEVQSQAREQEEERKAGEIKGLEEMKEGLTGEVQTLQTQRHDLQSQVQELQGQLTQMQQGQTEEDERTKQEIESIEIVMERLGARKQRLSQGFSLSQRPSQSLAMSDVFAVPKPRTAELLTAGPSAQPAADNAANVQGEVVRKSPIADHDTERPTQQLTRTAPQSAKTEPQVVEVESDVEEVQPQAAKRMRMSQDRPAKTKIMSIFPTSEAKTSIHCWIPARYRGKTVPIHTFFKPDSTVTGALMISRITKAVSLWERNLTNKARMTTSVAANTEDARIWYCPSDIFCLRRWCEEHTDRDYTTPNAWNTDTRVACDVCVRENRLCFVRLDRQMGIIVLLPLAEEHRDAMTDGSQASYWVQDSLQNERILWGQHANGRADMTF